MPGMNVPVPESLIGFVQSRVAEGGFGSVSDYVGSLIREDQKRRAWEALEKLAREGLESGEATPLTAGDFEEIRQEVRRRVAGRRSTDPPAA